MPLAAEEEGAGGATLLQWRERILGFTLTASAILAGIAYVPGVIAALRAELWVVVIVDTVAWATVIVLALWRTGPYVLRAGVFVAMVYGLALFLMISTGPAGGGAVWLLAFPTITVVFLGLRGVIVALSLTVATVVGLAGLIALDRVPVAPDLPGGGYDLGAWIGTGGSLVFLAFVLSLSIGYLVRGLEGSIAEVQGARRELSQANAQLRNEIREREEIEGKLIQSQKLEALGTLAGGIAHDFNNLLVPILAGTGGLRDRLPAGDPGRDELDEIARSASRARDLVRRILTFSRGTPEEREPVQVEPIVREVGTLLRSSLPAEIAIRYEMNAPGARVLASTAELHQILMNLATNAYLAMKPRPGTLTLRVARVEDEAMVSFTVEDTGVGMPAEVRDRAFDPFFTRRAPGEGTGLGLAIVHGLVKSFGGSIELYSEEGKGTRVEINLPEVRTDDEPLTDSPAPLQAEERSEEELTADVAESPGTPGEEGKVTVLLVDDEPMVRRTLGRVLTRAGYLVRETVGPEAALRIVRQSPDAFDLLLTDQNMPGMSGLDLAEAVRSVRPDLPIVLSSGYLDDDTMVRLERLGIEGSIEKPYNIVEIQAVIERALADPSG